jgi:hypothetical protein
MKIAITILRFKPAIGGGEEQVYQISALEVDVRRVSTSIPSLEDVSQKLKILITNFFNQGEVMQLEALVRSIEPSSPSSPSTPTWIERCATSLM